MNFYLLVAAFFVIALVYALVGFGGGSSYLALMALAGISIEIMRPSALLCNVIVVTGGTAVFYKEKLLDLRRNWPFLAASVPCAFIGGYWPVREAFFFQLLGTSLVVAAVLLWIQPENPVIEAKAPARGSVALPAVIGGSIGILSGLVSIGGGIFLSPLLHLMRWDKARKISALASLFILVNSISGLAGRGFQSLKLDWQFIVPLLIAVFAGGQIGSRLGVRTFNVIYIKRITAVLILVAGINILKDHWPF